MMKVLYVAWREFTSTVVTKGFIIGVLIFPAIMSGAMFLMPALMNNKLPEVTGELAVIDRSGAVAGAIGEQVNPTALAREHDALVEQTAETLLAKTGEVFGEGKIPFISASIRKQAEEIVGPAPKISTAVLDPGSDIEQEKQPLTESGDDGRLALLVVDPNAVEKDAATGYGSYAWYTQAKLDDRIKQTLDRKVRQAIIDARIRASGQDPATITALTNVRARESKAVTLSGDVESGAAETANIMLPFGFMILLWIATFTGGQYLLTTTIEEKASRVIEVLLSAVSPVQLMTGKIIGQMCVGLMILGIYAAIGVGALVNFQMLSFVDLGNLGYLAVFFFIAFFLLAAMMAAIGSAVNEMREAQSLMGPIMIVMMVPMILWLPITRDPNGTLATVLSLVPPISPFAMILRIAASEPVPFWQVALSIVIGIAAVFFTVRLAAKVFRVGVLMYGKPPNFRTLIRWVRMA